MKIFISDMGDLKPFRFEGSGPWTKFQSSFISKGHSLVDNPKNADFLVLNSIKAAAKVLNVKSLKGKPRVLIVWEPPANIGKQWRRVMQAKHRKVFKPSNLWNTGHQKTGLFNWPQGGFREALHSNVAITKSQSGACLLLSNKISFHASELYSLRRELAHRSTLIDVYGMNWNAEFFVKLRLFFVALAKNPTFSFFRRGRYFFTTPKMYKGRVKDKILTHSKYLVSIVIENSPDYVSEKLFDCIVSKSVPIYVGPPLTDFGIPRELALTTKANFKDIEEAIRLLLMDEQLRKKYLEAGYRFINSNKFTKHSNENVLLELANAVCHEIELGIS